MMNSFEILVFRPFGNVVAAFPSDLSDRIVAADIAERGDEAMREAQERLAESREKLRPRLDVLRVDYRPYSRADKVNALRKSEAITEGGGVALDAEKYRTEIMMVCLGKTEEEVGAMSPIEFDAIYRELVMRCEPDPSHLAFFADGPMS